jgi:hypothetical protein
MEKEDLEVLPGFKEGRFAKWLRRVIYPIAARTPFRVFLSLLVASALMWVGLFVASTGTSAGNYPAMMAGAVMMLGSAIGIFLPIASAAAVYRRQDAELAALVMAAVCSQIPIPDPSSTDEVDTKEG